MQAYAVLMLLPMLMYALVQTYRDVRRRNWAFVAWGGGTIIFIGWIIEVLTRAPSF